MRILDLKKNCGQRPIAGGSGWRLKSRDISKGGGWVVNNGSQGGGLVDEF